MDSSAHEWSSSLECGDTKSKGAPARSILREIRIRKLRSGRGQLDSATMRESVVRARGVQSNRFGDGKGMTNSRMSHKQVEKSCPLDSSSELILKQAMTEFGLSARAHDKVCKVARTIADLAGAENLQPEHIAEAISYRKLDRKL